MGPTTNIAAAVNRAAEYVQATWQQVVMGTTQVPGATNPSVNIGLRQIYAESITLGRMLVGQTGTSQSVVAIKKIAEDLENGKHPWDMKPMLLGGPKARVGKNGRYNIIPMRHGTSAKYSPNSNFTPMPTDIYKQARQVKASVRNGNKMSWGGRLTGTEQKYAPGHNPTTNYAHKNGKYEGMVRIEKQYAKATQNKYMTFRIVSDKSDPMSWWHPGYEAHHIAQGVSDFCRPAVEQMVREAAEQDVANVIISMGVN